MQYPTLPSEKAVELYPDDTRTCPGVNCVQSKTEGYRPVTVATYRVQAK